MTGGSDRQAIADLAVRYSFAVDDRDLETVLACFAPGATFRRRGTEVTDLRPFYETMLARYDLTIHTVHGHLVTVDGATGTGVQAGSAELLREGTMMRAAYRYSDSYVRTESGWQFARRELSFLYTVPDGEPFPSGPDRIRWPGEAPRRGELPAW